MSRRSLYLSVSWLDYTFNISGSAQGLTPSLFWVKDCKPKAWLVQLQSQILLMNFVYTDILQYYEEIKVFYDGKVVICASRLVSY